MTNEHGIRGRTLARLYRESNQQALGAHVDDDHNLVYREVREETRLRIKHSALADRRNFLHNLLRDNIGTREIERVTTRVLQEPRRSLRSAEHVRWVRQIIRVRISKLDRDIAGVTRLLNGTVADNNNRFANQEQRSRIRRIIRAEVRFIHFQNKKRLKKKRQWLNRLYNCRSGEGRSNNIDPAQQDDSEAAAMLSCIKASDGELVRAYEGDSWFAESEDFVVYGEVTLTEEEKAFLNLPPKFRIYKRPNEEQVETEIEKSHLKARYQLMGEEDRLRDDNDRSTEIHRRDRNSQQEPNVTLSPNMYTQPNNNEGDETPKMSFVDHRVTDFPTNTMVLAPKHASEDNEIRMHSRKRKIMETLKEYERDTNNNSAGHKTNLSFKEAAGLRSLRRRVENNEIVVNPTDKSGKYSVTTPGLYRAAAMEHISKDIEVTEREAERVEVEANRISMHMISVLKLGQANNHEKRIRSAFKSSNNPPPATYFYFKDHKNIEEGKQCPPTRPICGADEGPLMRLSNLVSDVLEVVVQNDEMTDILCESTEDMLSRVEQANAEVASRTREFANTTNVPKGDVPPCNMFFTERLITMSEDVEALYPSLSHDDTVCAIENIMGRSNVIIDARWKEISKYVAVNRNTCTIEANLERYIPVPNNHNQRGRPRTNAFLSQTDDRRWEWSNEREPSEDEVRKLFTIMIKDVVSFIMRNHVYTFDKKVYKQAKGGPIGLRLTGVLAKLIIIEFGRRWKRTITELGIWVPLDGIYVDDHNIATWGVKPGVRYCGNNKVMYFDPDSVMSDVHRSAEARTADLVTSITNTLMPESIRMKHDISENHSDNWLPVLDLKLQVVNNKIVTKFYKKPMATNKVIHKRSAMSTKTKRSVLIQEGLRRLYNCSPDLPVDEKAKTLGEFAMSMKISGHTQSFRSYIIKAVVNKYINELQAHRNRTKPLYRTKQERARQTHQTKSKASWLEKMGYNNLLVLPSTPRSKLAKMVTNKLRNIEEPDNIKTYIMEDYGLASKQLVSRSNQFPKPRCGDALCIMCNENEQNSETQRTKCLISNVGYSITCKSCNSEYIGTTSRNCRTRSREHISKRDSAINKHVIEKHPEDHRRPVEQYNMRVTRRFRDPVNRQGKP